MKSLRGPGQERYALDVNSTGTLPLEHGEERWPMVSGEYGEWRDKMDRTVEWGCGPGAQAFLTVVLSGWRLQAANFLILESCSREGGKVMNEEGLK